MNNLSETHVKRLALSNAVTLVGAVPHNAIKEYLNASDIFLITNDLTNMCNTLIEALTAGCCVVTREAGSTTEIVTHNANAVVLKPGEAKDIARAVVELLKDPTKRGRLAQAAYEGAMQRFQTWDERIGMEVSQLRKLREQNVRQ